VTHEGTLLTSALRKYSSRAVAVLEPGPLEGIMQLLGRVELQEGAYLTTNKFGTSIDAQRYLAITYRPTFENVYALTNRSIEGIRLVNPYLEAMTPSRVWPAFGHHGGGCEIVLVKGSLKCTQSSERWPQDGHEDDFHQDSVVSDPVFARELAQILWDWLQDRKADYPK
jgi:hypothetical protein